MIKLKIDIVNDKLNLVHDMFCKEHTIDELLKVLDIIVTDYELKTVPSMDKLSIEEKEQFVVKKRNQYLQEMMNKECSCKDYLFDNTTHIRS